LLQIIYKEGERVAINKNRVHDDEMFRTVKGPFGVVRVCKFCEYRVVMRTGISGVGVGYGFREGNKARGKMIQHYNKEHKA